MGASPPRSPSQISDASSAMLIASEPRSQEHGLKPRARIHHMSVRGDDPIYMLTGPIPATKYAFAKAGMIGRRHRPLRVQRSFRSRRAGVDARLRHPAQPRSTSTAARSRSATRSAQPAARLMTTLLNELERTGGRYGLQTMCEGGGQANVTIIERL